MNYSVFSLRSLLYLIYAVVLTAVFLYVRFPAEKFKAFCERQIEQLLPGSDCDIERIAYHFPLSAGLQTVKITRTIEEQESEIVVDQLEITPEPLQFWRAFSIQGEMYSGLFQADLNIDRKAQAFQLSDILLEGLAAGELAVGVGLGDGKISGSFGFVGEYQASVSRPNDGSGKGIVQVDSGSLTPLQPILALSTIQFEKIAVNVTRQDSIIRFEDGELVGKEITADFIGDLRLVSPLLNSNILLSGHMQPDDLYLKSHPKEQQLVRRLLQRYKVTVLPFKVGGTVKRPLFRFSK